MNEPHDPNRTVDVSSVPVDALDAGLAAGFGRAAEAPRSSLDGSQRPVLLREAKGESDHVVKPNSDAMPPRSATGDRYQLFGEIARGGMGAVLRGRDVDLGRDLAVKILLEKHAERPEVARRFIEEAQIGGQLQHSGVVPVYDIGRFGERPFFTMKLVKGQTLAALLGERADPTADRPRLLDIALKVTQALAYAHAKGVIHRDLKPANVMVGAFGEVQVMDWGLAKVLAEGGVADEDRASRQHQPEQGTLIRTARSSGSDTEAGSLLGTPAYMPPEQANGDVANLDRRADVFGLGAILCEVLTGKPPYVGRSAEEVRRKAANGDLADATTRLNACGADAELLALTKACLAPEAIDRPKDAQAVADRLTAYLDGVQERLHQAELAEAEARARAIEESKRRRLTLALAATVLLAVTLGGGGWLWVKADRDARQAQVTREVNDALNKATALREQAKTVAVGGAALFAQAREQTQRALALVENGPADEVLKEQVRDLAAELDEEEKDRQLLAALEEARLAQAENVAGQSRFARERAVPLFREALRAYGLPAGVGEPAAIATRIRQRPALVRETVLAALDEWIDLATNPQIAITEPHRDWLQAVIVAAEPEDSWTRRFQAARAEKDGAKRRAALEKLAAETDVQKMPAQSLASLAGQLESVKAGASAVRLLRRAWEQYPADFWINQRLGQALRKVTPPEREEAVRFLTAALALRPESAGACLNLGVALAEKGQVDKAIACYQKAIVLDPKSATTHNNLGSALQDKGQLDEAIACYHKAITLEPKFAGAHSNLGNALKGKGQLDEAIACYQKAIAFDPKFALAHSNLGVALQDKGQLEKAIACYQKAIAFDPKFANTHTNLGLALQGKGQFDEAIACFKKTISLDPQFAGAHSNLGLALAGKGQVDEAIACFKKAIVLDPKLALAHNNLGSALKDKGQVDEAIACYQKAIVLEPKYTKAHSNLGIALYDKGQLDAAIACFKKAIALEPKFANAHNNLGSALKDKGQLDAAIACYQKAIALEPKFAMAHNNLGIALLGKGQLDKAIACYQKAIVLDPKSATTHNNLGNALQDKGQLDEAIACYHKAITLEPKFARAHSNLGNALKRKGQVDEAIACYQKAIAFDPKYALAHYNLGLALYGKGQLDMAIACFKKAIVFDPKNATAHGALGQALLGMGRYAEARDASARAQALLPVNHPLRAHVFRQLQECGRLLKLEDRLPGILRGEDQPGSARESLDLVQMCGQKKMNAAAARFSATAFAAEAKLADDLQAGHRYNAACYATLAAAGQGEDAAKLDDKERARLRKQALNWLKADLALRSKQLQSGWPGEPDKARAALAHWQKDSDLAGIRDQTALDKLPAEEQKAFTQLWADVAALLKKAEAPAKKETPR